MTTFTPRPQWIVDLINELAGGAGGVWGSITGTLADQTDLQTALNAKVDDSQISAFGGTLIDDADAAAARTTLGLGTAATSAATAFAASGSTTASGLTMATGKMLGRSTASTGAIEEITVGSGLILASGSLSVTTDTGTLSGNDVKPVDVPQVSSFSWVNQGTASATDTDYGIVLTNDADGEFHILDQAAPSTPFDVYARFTPLMLENTANVSMANQPAIILRDSAGGDFISIQNEQGRLTSDLLYRFQIGRWTNPTTFSSYPVTKYTHQYYPWIRVNVTSTTITAYVLFAGSWIEIGQETIATFVGTINRVGFGMRSDTGMDAAYCAIGNFGFTDPLA